MGGGRDVGKRALWIQILEIDQNIKKTFPSMSPVFLAVGTLAKLKEYCKENGFTRIMCGAIDSRTADFYRRGGFSGNSLLLSYTI